MNPINNQFLIEQCFGCFPVDQLESESDKAFYALESLWHTDTLKENMAILEANKDNEVFKKLLLYGFHPQWTYKMSSRILYAECARENSKDIPPRFTNFFEMCDELNARKGTDTLTRRQVGRFLLDQPYLYQIGMIHILGKTLRVGLDAKRINKVIPNLIPEWEVQQAFPIEKYPLKPGTWFAATQKLNGIRATYHDGRLVGRSGMPLQGLQHIVSALNPYRNYVFDGELTLADTIGLSDNEAFRTAAGIVNSDQPQKPEIIFTVFDMLPVEQFEGSVPADSYKARRAALDAWEEEQGDDSPVKVLPLLYAGTDTSKVDELLNQMVLEDKEGLMVNLDVPYQRKRHKGILKVKRFYTMDLPILRCEKGSGRLSETLGALVVDYMGNEVGVGSGFTDEQREWFWSHREDVVGELAEIKYKDISQDKLTEKLSLQFPVFVSLRTDKSDVSFG